MKLYIVSSALVLLSLSSAAPFASAELTGRNRRLRGAKPPLLLPPLTTLPKILLSFTADTLHIGSARTEHPTGSAKTAHRGGNVIMAAAGVQAGIMIRQYSMQWSASTISKQ